MEEAMSGVPYVINIGNPLQMGGTHWVAVWKNYYMDSFGLPPTHILIKTAPRGGFIQATKGEQIQSVASGGCGQYSLYFLYLAVMKGEEGIKEFNRIFKIYD